MRVPHLSYLSSFHNLSCKCHSSSQSWTYPILFFFQADWTLTPPFFLTQPLPQDCGCPRCFLQAEETEMSPHHHQELPEDLPSCWLPAAHAKQGTGLPWLVHGGVETTVTRFCCSCGLENISFYRISSMLFQSMNTVCASSLCSQCVQANTSPGEPTGRWHKISTWFPSFRSNKTPWGSMRTFPKAVPALGPLEWLRMEVSPMLQKFMGKS